MTAPRRRTLGRTDIAVGPLCLGTMTFGHQNTAREAEAQMDQAVDAGVHFLDTAEMYPFPSAPGTWGLSESIVGDWMAARGNRDKMVVASKITGPGARLGHIRGGDLRFGPEQIRAAVDGSLKRLRTDYIDLYQLHWPQRSTNFFGQLGYRHKDGDTGTPLEETLGALADMVAAGKVRAVGVSNETPWGLMRLLALAEAAGLPRVAAIQNPYSLLNRLFEVGLAEIAIREDCGLLAYAPMAGGVLSGKYLGGARPAGARFSLAPHMTRYFGPSAEQATGRYVAVARRHGLTPATLALTFVNTRPFVTSTIVGATTLDQLRADIATIDATLSDAALADIEAVHTAIPDPCP